MHRTPESWTAGIDAAHREAAELLIDAAAYEVGFYAWAAAQGVRIRRRRG